MLRRFITWLLVEPDSLGCIPNWTPERRARAEQITAAYLGIYPEQYGWFTRWRDQQIEDGAQEIIAEVEASLFGDWR